MPIRQLFRLVKLGKNICYAYRARSVEAIHLYKKLAQDLVPRCGPTKDDVRDMHRFQPETGQNDDFLQSKNTHEKILGAICDAVQMACSTTGTNGDIDSAFDSISDLMKGPGKEKKFAPSLETLEQAKQRDEHTIRLVGHFSAKYGRNEPIKFKKKEKHSFTVHYGNQKVVLELLVDHPPQVHALAWRLNKRCSSATKTLALRNPRFYPYPFIEGLNDHSIGRPLGLLGGPTYGLKPWSGEWTPRIEVYGDDLVAWCFKVESGGFSSTFKDTIMLENPKHVVLRDIFGQLVTQNAVENLVRKFGNNEEKRHSVWNSGKSQADALRIMAETPFLDPGIISTWVAAIPSPQPWEPPPPPYILLPTNSETQDPLLSPKEPSRQSPPIKCISIVGHGADDSGVVVFPGGCTTTVGLSETVVRGTSNILAEPGNRLRAFKRSHSKVNGKGIGAALSIASSSAVFLSPDSSGAFPEAKFEEERKKSWLRRHMVDPVKKIVREVVQ